MIQRFTKSKDSFYIVKVTCISNHRLVLQGKSDRLCVVRTSGLDLVSAAGKSFLKQDTEPSGVLAQGIDSCYYSFKEKKKV